MAASSTLTSFWLLFLSVWFILQELSLMLFTKYCTPYCIVLPVPFPRLSPLFLFWCLLPVKPSVPGIIGPDTKPHSKMAVAQVWPTPSTFIQPTYRSLCQIWATSKARATTQCRPRTDQMNQKCHREVDMCSFEQSFLRDIERNILLLDYYRDYSVHFLSHNVDIDPLAQCNVAVSHIYTHTICI